MYHNFIGIDIGKFEFFVSLHKSNKVEKFTNSTDGIAQFYKQYNQQLQQSLVIVETTGGYEMALIKALQQERIAVHRANTRIVKSFIRSTGKLGKSDTIDAIGLARYASERYQDLSLYQAPSEDKKKLVKLVSRKKELQLMLIQEKNRLTAPDNQILHESYLRSIKSLESMIKDIKDQIQGLVKSDKLISKKIDTLKTEIDGVGEIIATELVVHLPELGQVSGKAIASLSGLAPHPNESGKKIGYRRTRGGREILKSILYMAAMAASRSKGILGQFYKSLIARGKKPMVALIAVARKIVVMANAKIRDLEQTEIVLTVS